MSENHESPDPSGSPPPPLSAVHCQLFGGFLDGLVLPVRLSRRTGVLPGIITTGVGIYTRLPAAPEDQDGRPVYRVVFQRPPI